MKYSISYQSPIGTLFLVEEKGVLIEVSYKKTKEKSIEQETEILAETKRQLDLYFKGELKNFDLPLNPKGTEFQKRVWKELLKIPYGEKRTYGEIAKAIGKEQAYRAIGAANHANPIAIVIPCHRVVGKNNSLTGYAGGLEKKRTLLAIEGNHYE